MGCSSASTYYSTIILYQVQEQSFSRCKHASFCYVENQSSRQICNINVLGSTANGHPYCHGAGRERNKKCPFVSEVYTRGKIRHFKHVSGYLELRGDIYGTTYGLKYIYIIYIERDKILAIEHTRKLVSHVIVTCY